MAAPSRDLIDLVVPLEQEGTKAVVLKWLKAPNEAATDGAALVELETDKVAVEIAAPGAGVLVEQLLQEGDEATPGAVLGRFRLAVAPQAGPVEALDAAAETPEAAASSETAPARLQWDPALRLSPSVRRLLAEARLDPAGLEGTGRDGRLTRHDVVLEIERRRAADAAPGPRPPGAALPAGAAGGTQSVPHTSMRRRIAEHMVHSVTTAPHVTAVFEADFSAVMAHRAAHRAEFERQGCALTYTAYIVAACARAMAAVPAVNARWHADHLEVFGDVNIGVGTALGDKGLIVPVIQRAQTLSLLGIASRLQDLTERARAGRLTPADVQNGTFSISNHGVSGSLIAAPIIINQPQSAILGVGKLEKRVVVREAAGVDSIQIRPMAYVSLTIDHRALDGVQTNAWLTRFVETLETWPPD